MLPERPRRTRYAVCPLVLAGTLGGAAMAATPRETADLVIVNGRLPTVEGDATAIAVKGDKITRVGKDRAVLALRGKATKVIDARGRSVLPGFNDNHVHLYWGARSLAAPDVRAQRDLAGIQKVIGDYAEANPDLDWIDAGGWLNAQLPGGAPDKTMLDTISTTRPIVLWSLDRHSAWVNSKALALIGVTAETPDPPNGEFVRYPVTRQPTGWLKEISAVSFLQAAMPKPSTAEHERMMTLAINEALRNGVTSVNEAFGNVEEFEILDGMRKHDKLSLRISYALGVTPGFSDAEFARYQAVWRAHPDTPLLKTGVVKFFLDGVPNAHTAFLLAPWGPQKDTGQSIYPRDEVMNLVSRFDAAGWQVMMHAMGDGAVRLGLDAVQNAETRNKPPARGRRHRIEHAFLVEPTDIQRFGKLKVLAAYQPVDMFLPPSTPADPPNPQRPPQEGARWNAVRAAGAHASLGSDWPVFTMNALARIYGIVDSRRADQRMSLKQALRAYTRESAYASFNEKTQGSLTPGQFADIVILSRDLVGSPPAAASDLAVDMTIFAGRVAYERERR